METRPFIPYPAPFPGRPAYAGSINPGPYPPFLAVQFQPEFQPVGSILWVLAIEKPPLHPPLLSPELRSPAGVLAKGECPTYLELALFFPFKATSKSNGGLNFVCDSY